MNSYFVYILASARNGTLYVGVTNNLELRIQQHKIGEFKGFTSKYNVNTLVWFEGHGDINQAIYREKLIKRWRRCWKLNLIESMNPDWRDLSDNFQP